MQTLYVRAERHAMSNHFAVVYWYFLIAKLLHVRFQKAVVKAISDADKNQIGVVQCDPNHLKFRG